MRRLITFITFLLEVLRIPQGAIAFTEADNNGVVRALKLTTG